MTTGAKKAIIIGATSGIGRALACLFLEEGYIIGATGRRGDLLRELQDAYPGNCFISISNVAEVQSLDILLNELVTRMGGADLIIICAGIGEINKELEFTLEEETVATNVLGFTAAAGWAFNLFQKQGYGHLAAITSIAGLRGSRHAPAYNATKAYQINYLEGLRQRSAHIKMPIFITDIRPGFVDTAMAKGPGQFWVSPVEKAASQILAALHNKRAVVYVTKRWNLIAVILRLLPRWLYKHL